MFSNKFVPVCKPSNNMMRSWLLDSRWQCRLEEEIRPSAKDIKGEHVSLKRHLTLTFDVDRSE